MEKPKAEQFEKLAQLAREQAKKVTDKLPILGPVTWLMTQQSATRHVFLADMEWRIMPALILDQAKLYMKDDMPIAFISWAYLSKSVSDRYQQSPHQLAPADWKSGEQIWIVDLIAPFGGGEEVLKDLRENLFPTATVFQLMPAPNKTVKTMEWPPIRGMS
jgi:cytolysin-activating lysine-acyltransferase